jgi:thiosulfate dehydrogenase (quinone) large subunit
MTTTRHHHDSQNAATETGAMLVETDIVTHGAARKGLAALRYAFGLTFLWAFFDKLLALGFHTGYDQEGVLDRFGPAAWVNGGSPTEGFLAFGVPEDNPFKDFFNGLAGQAWVDWLFMIGLLGIGLALTLGIGMRVAAATGASLYMMMYAAALPLENNPVIDDHLIGAIAVIVLALTLAGDTWGAGRAWARTRLVRRFPVLR